MESLGENLSQGRGVEKSAAETFQTELPEPGKPYPDILIVRFECF